MQPWGMRIGDFIASRVRTCIYAEPQHDFKRIHAQKALIDKGAL